MKHMFSHAKSLYEVKKCCLLSIYQLKKRGVDNSNFSWSFNSAFKFVKYLQHNLNIAR